MEKKIGIWLDNDNAIIVSLVDDQELLQKIESRVEHFHIHGGSRSSTPYGPQDAVSDSKLMYRKKQQMKNYFKRIMAEIKDASSIAIFGPAEAKNSLAKELEQDSVLSKMVYAVQTADSMTEKQKVALIKDFYQS